MVSVLEEAGLLPQPPHQRSSYAALGVFRELKMNRPSKKKVNNGCSTKTICPGGVDYPKCT